MAGAERVAWTMPSHGPAHLLRVRPVNPARLTPAQKRVLAAVDGTLTGYISNPPIYGRPFKALGKRDHKILIALVLGGALELWRVRGPLPGDHPPHHLGARADYHYAFRAAAPLCRCRHPLHAGQCPAADGCWCDTFTEGAG